MTAWECVHVAVPVVVAQGAGEAGVSLWQLGFVPHGTLLQRARQLHPLGAEDRPESSRSKWGEQGAGQSSTSSRQSKAKMMSSQIQKEPEGSDRSQCGRKGGASALKRVAKSEALRQVAEASAPSITFSASKRKIVPRRATSARSSSHWFVMRGSCAGWKTCGGGVRVEAGGGWGVGTVKNASFSVTR